MKPLLAIDDLTIRAPDRRLVEGISFEVFPREVTALVGPSGAGKSLTARACMCVLDVDPGLERGSLRYPALDPDKDWYEGVRGKGMRAQRSLLKRSRALRGAYFTYSPQAASSATKIVVISPASSKPNSSTGIDKEYLSSTGSPSRE